MNNNKITEKILKKVLMKFKQAIKSDRRPSGYYYNNKTNKEYWKGAKQGWRDCIDYISNWGELDEEFSKLISLALKDKDAEIKKKIDECKMIDIIIGPLQGREVIGVPELKAKLGIK